MPKKVRRQPASSAMSSAMTAVTKPSAHQHLQISHNPRRASRKTAPALKTKLIQMANAHLAIARVKAQAERLSAARAPAPPTVARSPGMTQLQSLKVSCAPKD